MSKANTYRILPAVFCITQVAAGQGDSLSRKEDSIMVVVEKLSINSPQSDFAPFRRGNTMYFVSGRVSQVAIQYSNENNDTEITDIYEASVKDPKKLRGVKSVEQVNTRYHEGPLTVSRSGKRMYLTSSDKKTMRLKLYASELTDGEWTKPSLLPFCADSFSYCHPALSVSEDTLFFSSNCCGQGKMDICYVTRTGETWSGTQALNTNVNGNHNELFPFPGSDGRFYFASDRPGGAGGLDIYRCNLSDNNRSAEPLAAPINSTADDFGIWTDSTGQSGYFSSNRTPRTGDDIFYFSRPIPDFSDSEPAPAPPSLCYEFFEDSSPNVDDSIKTTYKWDFGDGGSATGTIAPHCFSKPGTYEVELNVVETGRGGFRDSTQTLYEIVIEEPKQLRIQCPDTISALTEVSFNSEGSSLKEYEITQRYWAFGDGFFKPGTEAKHIFKKEGKYTVQLWVVASHKKDRSTKKFRMSKEIVVKYAQ